MWTTWCSARSPIRDPGPSEVLLRVRFAGLNPADAFLSQGLYPAKPPLPHILGRDAVGDVIEVGPNVTSLKPGDTVGILRCDVGVKVWGTLAEKTVIPAASAAPVPHGWTIEEMSGAPLDFSHRVAGPHPLERPAGAAA